MAFLELLYAGRIRSLAMEAQSIARKAAEKAAGERWEDGAGQWEFENPLATFIERVHEELEAIALHARQL